MGVIMGYATRRCPRCGAELYADMDVCYGCLYDFTRDRPRDAGVTDRSLARRHAGEVGVVARTQTLDAWLPVGERGASVGRDDSNDVVLHSIAVSGCHVRLVPTPDGMEVIDLSSSGHVTYCGRVVEGRAIVPYGDAVDICDCALTMTGPAPSGSASFSSPEKSL